MPGEDGNTEILVSTRNMKNAILDQVKVFAQSMGVSICRYPPTGSLERQLRDLLSQMEINVVLDVGAFIGNFAMMLRELGYEGRIISFEPSPDSYGRLCARMQHDSLWSGHPFGLSDDSREALMNLYSNQDLNSLLTLHSDAQVAYSVDPSRARQIPIQLKRLDA